MTLWFGEWEFSQKYRSSLSGGRMTFGCARKLEYIQVVPVFSGPTPMNCGPFFSASFGIIQTCDAALGFNVLRSARLYRSAGPRKGATHNASSRTTPRCDGLIDLGARLLRCCHLRVGSKSIFDG